jgi:hypothetical protein
MQCRVAVRVWCALAVSRTARIRLRRLALSITCASIALTVVLAIGYATPPTGDAPSHLFQTWLYRHGGFSPWNNYWYAGRYEFVTYSAFYYPLAAQFGQVLVLAASAAVLCSSFALVVQAEWGRTAARGPALAFAVTAPFVGIVSGVYPFMVASACAMLALLFLQRRMRISFALATFATLGFSPLAFALLVALLAGVLLGQRQPLTALRQNRVAFAAVLAVFVAGVLAERAFPTGAWYPYDFSDAAIVLGFSLIGLFMAGTSRRARSVRMLFAAYLALNLIAFLLKSPIGSNATRLFAIGGMPLLWLAINVGHRRSRLIVIPVLAGAMALQVGPMVRDAYSAWNSPAASARYWQPAIEFLDHHNTEGYRVEAVATWGHWDAYYLARHVPLARGWYRQDDFPQNDVLYRPGLSPIAYQNWLRSLGVRYVLLPDTALDYSSKQEAALLLSGRSGLFQVGHTKHWRFYELPGATPIVSAPPDEKAELELLEPDRIWLHVSGPGSYLVRVRYSPYWKATLGSACIAPAPDGMMQVTASQRGLLGLEVRPGVDSVADTMQDADTSC